MRMSLMFEKNPPRQKPRFEVRNDVAHAALEQSRLDDLPFVEAQEELELLFDKNQTSKRISKEFEVPEFVEMVVQANLPEGITMDFCRSLVTQMCIQKRASASTMVGMLYHHFDAGQGIQLAMQACADALEKCVEANLVDFDFRSEELVVRLEMTAETQRDLDRFQYPLPMVTQPKRIVHNRQNGYLNDATSRSLVVLRTGRQKEFYENADVCIDHLNKMNSIPLALNLQVVSLIDNEWANLDRRKPKETEAEYEARVKAFKRYDECSRDVIHAISQLRNRFWLTHKYDRRGRVYCQGYHVNYQGNPWNKAVIEFANKELVDG